MIKSYKSKRLEDFSAGDYSKVDSRHLKAVRVIMAALNSATEIGDLRLPGKRLHQHKGTNPVRWSLDVSGNYRITFEFENGHVYAVDYGDPH